jgi:hypothetical protein
LKRTGRGRRRRSREGDIALGLSDQAKAISLRFLRDMKKGQLVQAFQEGFEANAKEKVAQRASCDRMLTLVPDVKEGGTMTFTYMPGKGTTLQLGDKDLGLFEGKPFADAVFCIWLGPEPPSSDLKRGLLGLESAPTQLAR